MYISIMDRQNEELFQKQIEFFLVEVSMKHIIIVLL